MLFKIKTGLFAVAFFSVNSKKELQQTLQSLTRLIKLYFKAHKFSEKEFDLKYLKKKQKVKTHLNNHLKQTLKKHFIFIKI